MFVTYYTGSSFLYLSFFSGLIPWDDDLDLCILESYENQLIGTVQKVLGKCKANYYLMVLRVWKNDCLIYARMSNVGVYKSIGKNLAYNKWTFVQTYK